MDSIAKMIGLSMCSDCMYVLRVLILDRSARSTRLEVIVAYKRHELQRYRVG